LGGGLGIVVFLRVLWLNGGIAGGGLFSGFYEIQAHAFRQLRWNVPFGSLGIEAFQIGSKQYEYYGPFPALLRMPLMFLFPSMDGRWTGPFMLLALVIALVASTRLNWRIRTLVRHDAPVTKVELFVVGVFTFALAAGSVLMFLASQVWVYHEAEIWGCALALAAFDFLTAYILEPKRSTLILTSLCATFSINSRASVGFGATLAILLLGGVTLFAWSRRLAGLPDSWAERKRAWLPIGAAAAVPIVTYMYVNYSKFGSLFVFPSNKQVFSEVDVYRKAMLARNNNSLFGFRFFPTALVQYLRPDALHFQWLVPFVNFPTTAHVFGNVLFDTIEPSSSVPSSMPILFLLAIVGVVAIALLGRRQTPLSVLRIAVLGAIASGATVVPYSYIAQRYMSDFVPFLVITALAGLHLVMRWAQARPRGTMIVAGVLSVLAVFSLWVNAGLAFAYHYESPLVPEGAIGNHLTDLYRWYSTFPGGTAPYVHQGATLPKPLARGSVYVVGNCDGVYYSQGNTWAPTTEWYAVARTPASGQYDMRVRFDKVDAPRMEPIVVRGSGNTLQTIAAYVTPNNEVRFTFLSAGHANYPRFTTVANDRKAPPLAKGFQVGPESPFVPGRSNTVQVTMDPNNGAVNLVFNGFIVYAFVDYRLKTPQLASYVFPTKEVEFGTNSVGARMDTTLSGTLTMHHDPRPPICKYLSLPRNASGATSTPTSR
jgi:hypothetical protein